MGQQVASALAALRELGAPDEIRVLAVGRFGPATPPRVNAHIHLPPNFSAFESVQQGREPRRSTKHRCARSQQLL